VEQKLDKLSESVDRRFDALSVSVDQRFDDVTAMLVEQRQYTGFAFDRLHGEMKAGFNSVDGRFDSLERKLDQFIDTQAKANQLVERRLQALETEPGNP
jgi:hypothetical protein